METGHDVITERMITERVRHRLTSRVCRPARGRNPLANCRNSCRTQRKQKSMLLRNRKCRHTRKAGQEQGTGQADARGIHRRPGVKRHQRKIRRFEYGLTAGEGWVCGSVWCSILEAAHSTQGVAALNGLRREILNTRRSAMLRALSQLLPPAHY